MKLISKVPLLFKTWRDAIRVKKLYGKSIFSQIKEIIVLHWGHNRINPIEYFDYRLFDDRMSFCSKKKFAGWRYKQWSLSFKDSRWDFPVRDKVMAQLYLEQLGLPCPQILAFCGPESRHMGVIPSFTPGHSMMEFLRSDITYPFFCKPVAASLGRDGIAVTEYDRMNNSLVLANGNQFPMEDFIQHLKEEVRGTVFQKMVHPHPRTVKYFGNRLSSVRVVSLSFKTGPRVFRAVLKIPTGTNMTDNFDHGQSGNVIAKVNIETGEIAEVISSTGINQKSIEKHQDTGQPLCGFVIPDWQDLIDVCKLATQAYPGLFIQHWDIAIGENGPVILEMNFPGDIDLLQHAYGEGILNDDLQELLMERGLA